ncbi:serine hydrolase [Cyanobium sp. CH-040]|uniref:serine hydrolase domain-containing protein n=1 Tax=Cyanobium sp. CH-040 TaxID=2823708 RepID=UPI0020CCB852|nr:serine hydrolase domain-containing protein [Cyanobium sp. CH-040]MCP9927443.1 beta-lactamase family protein [Cyanobium sp. CH-040]
MAEVHGRCDPRFSPMAELLSANVEAGRDVGASVAVTLDGSMVVDIWSGWTDASRTTPWQADTITNVWSSTKTVTSLAALVLVDRGELDVFRPVCHYWPEFAANGKAEIEVRHLLSHASGVSGWDQPVDVADLADLQVSTALLAAQSPWWPPGTASGYHDRNFGHLIGELIRRITGQTLGEFLATEIAGPLAADFHIGLDRSHVPRVSNVIPFEGPLPIDLVSDHHSVRYRTLRSPSWAPQVSWTSEWREAEIGAANGHGNARSLVRLLSVIACSGEVDGVRLLSPETVELIFQEQSNGMDLVIGIPVRWGIGYALRNEGLTAYFPSGRVCGWGGWGGSIVLADVDRRMSISYVMNRMEDGSSDDRGPAFVRAAYAAIGMG